MRASVASARGRVATIPPSEHDDDPVAERAGAPGSRTRRRGSRSPARGLEEQAVDLGLRADVDPAGRLVEHQHARCRREPLAEHDLLLVAAGERRDRDPGGMRADLELGDRLRSRSPARAFGSDGEGESSREVDAITRFSCTLMSSTRPCSLRSAGTKRGAAADRLARVAERARVSRRSRPSPVRDGAARRASRATRSGLPRRGRRGRRSRPAPTSRSTSANAPGEGEPADAQARRRPRSTESVRRHDLLEGASDHQVDRALTVELRRGPCSDACARRAAP